MRFPKAPGGTLSCLSAPGGSWQAFACLALEVHRSRFLLRAHLACSPICPCECVSIHSFLQGHVVSDLGPTRIQKDLILTRSHLFPKKVTSPAAVDVNLGGLLFNPVQGVCIQVEEGAGEEAS